MENNDPFSAASAEGAKEKKPGGFSNLLLVIIALLNFLAVAGIGAYLVLGQPNPAQVAQAQPQGLGAAVAGEQDGAIGGADQKPSGPLLPLDPIVTNLSDPDSDRYLKVVIQLRVTSDAAEAEVAASMVPIRSQILLFLSSLTVAEISGSENKRAIQEQVKRIANETLPVTRIAHVYFTEFVIQ